MSLRASVHTVNRPSETRETVCQKEESAAFAYAALERPISTLLVPSALSSELFLRQFPRVGTKCCEVKHHPY